MCEVEHTALLREYFVNKCVFLQAANDIKAKISLIFLKRYIMSLGELKISLVNVQKRRAVTEAG